MGTNTKKLAPPESASILDSLRHLVQGFRVAARAAESELGISGAQLFVLQKLGEEPAMSVNELAARTCTHQSSVSVVVHRLVDRNLVHRDADPSDRRRVVLSLTPAGRKLLSRSPVTAQNRLIAAIGQLPTPSRKQLATLLSELVSAMGLGQTPPAMLFEPDEHKPRKSR